MNDDNAAKEFICAKYKWDTEKLSELVIMNNGFSCKYNGIKIHIICLENDRGVRITDWFKELRKRIK